MVCNKWLKRFAKNLESFREETVEGGYITNDLTLCTHGIKKKLFKTIYMLFVGMFVFKQPRGKSMKI